MRHLHDEEKVSISILLTHLYQFDACVGMCKYTNLNLAKSGSLGIRTAAKDVFAHLGMWTMSLGLKLSLHLPLLMLPKVVK